MEGGNIDQSTVTVAKGTLLGYDGTIPIKMPHKDCILIMPGRRFTPGFTAVR